MVQENNSSVISDCIKKLQKMGNTELLIPQSIHRLAIRCTAVKCNFISETLAKTIVEDDMVHSLSESLWSNRINEELQQHFMGMPQDSIVMIHHLTEKGYETTVATFHSVEGGTLFFTDRAYIEAKNVVAAVKIPSRKEKEIARRSLNDNNHVVFNILTQRSYLAN